jgi:pyridoxine kinase
MLKRVITIQDVSCVGKCSLTVALPILSAAGLEASILPTAILSTHTGGFTGYTFRDLTDDIQPVCENWKTLGLRVDALYTGYLGGHDQLALVSGIFNDFRQEDTLILVDPAMADEGRLYPAFDMSFALGMRELCSLADIIAPNLTEACLMLQLPYPGEDYDQAFIEDILRRLSALGPQKVVLTGVSFEDGKLGAAAWDASKSAFSYYFTDRVAGYYHGTGDIYSSVLLGALLNGASMQQAIRIACEFTVGTIRRTAAEGSDPKYGVDFEHGIGGLVQMIESIGSQGSAEPTMGLS